MKNKRWINIVLILIVFVVFSVRIIFLNLTFPNAENIYIAQGASGEIQKYFTMKVNHS